MINCSDGDTPQGSALPLTTFNYFDDLVANFVGDTSPQFEVSPLHRIKSFLIIIAKLFMRRGSDWLWAKQQTDRSLSLDRIKNFTM
jgi:hypothetical protein